MSASQVTATTTDRQHREPAAHDPRDTGPRPPLPVPLMQAGHHQGDHQGDAPDGHPDLEHSSGVDGQWLGLFGTHTHQPMRLLAKRTLTTLYA